MDVTQLKTQRKSLRTSFTICAKGFEEELMIEAPNMMQLSVSNSKLGDKFSRLAKCQTEISDLILKSENCENEFEEDFLNAEKYRDRYTELCAKYEQLTLKQSETKELCDKRKFKLPTIELPKFDGDAKNYLTFWSQFRKIHEDTGIPNEDKFQYLMQAVVPKSKAARVVESFPATADNYPKAIAQLQERFGRDDLLVQIYVRDLLNLVMKNASSGRSRTDLPALYDELEAKIRALEALGRTQEKYGDFLSPLVESCLPESVLLVWERNVNHGMTEDSKGTRTLEQLMTFLRQEVKGEEMLHLARTGFAKQDNRVKYPGSNQVNYGDRTTASALVNFPASGKSTYDCIFCEKCHPSEKCFAARKMSLAARQNILRKKGACFACLKRAGHLYKFCDFKKQLNCTRCKKHHYELMCDLPKGGSELKTDVIETNSLSNNCRKNDIYLMTLTVNVRVNGKKIAIRCLIDTGSQYSYLSRHAIEKLGIESKRKIKMQHMLFGGRKTQNQFHNVYELFVSSIDESFNFRLECFQEDRICGTVPKVCSSNVINNLRQRGIVLSDLETEDCEIGLLLGADVAGGLFMEGSTELDAGLFLLKTRLGFIITGKHEISFSCNERCDTALNVLSLFVKEASVSDLWSLESIGILDPVQRLNESNEHLKVIEGFKNSLKILADGRYELCLPFKSDVIEMSSNKESTWKRHTKMCERAKRSGLLDDYKAVFREWEELHIIEKCNTEIEFGYFLPHRPVVKTDSATFKIRPVFDASARKTGERSLNDLLYKGPNLVHQIPDVIDRFRSFPIGLSADIERAFLQLGIAPEHRDFLRFFCPTEDEQIIYRHCRVVFGVSSSPFLLAATLTHLFENVPMEEREMGDKLKLSFYVDNCVAGVADITKQDEFILRAKEILSRGCFNLRNWESNAESKYTSRSTGITKLLGILWDLDRDVLKCNVSVEDLKADSNITKRFILAVVQKIFDPLGILCSATLYPKILLQNTWKLKLSWDAPLPDDIVKPFLKWWSEVEKLSDIEIPRYFEINETTQMHVFVDACKEAYATCVFLRSDTSQGVKVVLVRAKSRVAPLKQITIPRLELMACCIGARLAHSIQQALNVTEIETIFWSDSVVALYWLNEKGGWSVFVSNRVREIKTLFPNCEWRHVPGKMNPADLISRGCSPGYLVESYWWEGPLWLSESPDTWPVTELIGCEAPEISSERRKIGLCNLSLSQGSVPWYARRFSKFHSILRLVAWVLRFIHNARGKINGRKTGKLTLKEIEGAEIHLIRSVQAQGFQGEKAIPNLCVFRDENNIIRVKTRIIERIDDPHFLAPILLPSHCIFTQRLIEHFHVINHHAGTQLLLSIIRERYWILGGRRTVRKIWNACVKCRRFKSKSLLADPVSLPADRVEDAAVFEVVGIDLAGPLYIKRGDKVWVVLYTCAIYRALHLELVSSLSTDAFLLSFRRFVARRGRPRIIYSDNGTNFKGAYNELAAIDWNEVSRHAEIQRITWRFIPPTAAWWGGFWERLVRTVKELLKRSLGRAVFTYEELLTILCECERVVNSRPLTYLSEDMLDLTPITPAMFLFDRSTAEVKDLDVRDANYFQKRIRFRANVMEGLRRRFRNEYLGQLIQRQRENPQSCNINVGDIVLIGDDTKKRLLWPLARVTELMPGKDGLVRTVKLRTQSCTLLRPIQRIFPLEINGNDLSNLPRHKVQPSEPSENNTGEASLQAPIPETSVNCPEVDRPQVTRYGRVTKKPNKLNLVTLNVFE